MQRWISTGRVAEVQNLAGHSLKLPAVGGGFWLDDLQLDSAILHDFNAWIF